MSDVVDCAYCGKPARVVQTPSGTYVVCSSCNSRYQPSGAQNG